MTIILEEASVWQHELETSQRTLVLVLFPERSSQGVSKVQLILSMIFFHPGHNFPFPSRDGIVIMENLGLKKKSHNGITQPGMWCMPGTECPAG